MAKKPVLTAAEAAKMIPDGATIMCGGFLACGQARAIVKELVKLGTKDLTLIANDMGRAVGPKGEEFFGIAELIHNHQVKRVIATHVGMTPDVATQRWASRTPTARWRSACCLRARWLSASVPTAPVWAAC